MSGQTFPSFQTVKINVTRTPMYATKIQTSTSGKELRCSWQSTPRYHYTLAIEALRTTKNGDEVATLMNFIDTHKGSYDSFFYTDPYSGQAVRVRFVDDEVELERVLSTWWGVKKINLISVK